MAVTVLDAISTTQGVPASVTISSGSNRKAYLVVGRYHGSAEAERPTTVTIGGVSGTRLGSQSVPSGSDASNTIYVWDESDIGSMSGTSVVVTGGGFTAEVTHFVTVQDADQGTDALSESTGSGTSDSLSLTRVADGYTFHTSMHDNGNNYSSSSNPAFSTQQDTSDTFAISAIGGESSTSETVDSDFTHTFSRAFEHQVWNIAPATGGTETIVSASVEAFTIAASNAALQANVDTDVTASVEAFTIAASNATVGQTLTQIQLTAATNRELRDETGALVASLNNINYEWYESSASTAGAPFQSGTLDTDANGEATVNIIGSNLTDGQHGTLVLFHPSNDDIRGVYRIPVVET